MLDTYRRNEQQTQEDFFNRYIYLSLYCQGAHSVGRPATSYQQLLRSPNSIGVPEGPLGRVWLSLPHLVSNWPGTPTQLLVELNWVI